MCQKYSKTPAFKDADFKRLSQDQIVRDQIKGSVQAVPNSHSNAHVTCPSIDYNDLLTSRSLKTRNENFDISFQSDFFEEHQKSFRKMSQNFIESSFIEKDSGKLGFLILDPYEISSTVVKNSNGVQLRQFRKDLEDQEKLSQFLKLIGEYTTKSTHQQLYLLASQAWQKYLQVRNPFINQKELIEISQNFAKQISVKKFEQGGIKFLNLEVVTKGELKDKKQVKQSFNKFITFYLTTVFLIIEQYFQNPYYEQKELKRSRDYTEHSFFTLDHQSEDKNCGNYIGFWGYDLPSIPHKKGYYD